MEKVPFIQMLSHYKAASYPLLFVETHEEQRLTAEIAEEFAYGENSKSVYTWDEQNGIVKFAATPGKEGTVEKNTDSVQGLMRFLMDFKERQSLILFKGLHPYLKHSKLIRVLLECVKKFKSKSITGVIISPVSAVPVELDRVIQLVEFPLPNETQLATSLDFITSSVAVKNKQLQISDETREAAIEASKGLIASQAEDAFGFSITKNKAYDQGFVEDIFHEKVMSLKKNSNLIYVTPDIGFDDIGGLNALKSWAKVRATAFSASAREYGLPYPKGVMLNGVPGTGKTLLGKAISREFMMPMFQLDVGSLFGSRVGETEENCRKVIQTVEGIGKCILFIDEIEKSLNSHATSGVSDSGTSSRMFATLLSWFSDHTSPVFKIATSNNFTILPPEFIRRGRFDELFWLDLPDEVERKEIWEVVIKKYKRLPESFDLEILVQNTEDFTGAEIDGVFLDTLFESFYQKIEINEDLLLMKIGDTRPQAKIHPENLAKLREEADGKLRNARDMSLAGGLDQYRAVQTK